MTERSIAHYSIYEEKRTMYVNADVVEDGEDEYIKIIVPQDGVVYDIMLQVQTQTNIDFEDGYYLEDQDGDTLKGKWHLDAIEADTLYLRRKWVVDKVEP